MANRATRKMIEKEKKKLQNENLMQFCIFLSLVCSYAALLSLAFCEHGSDWWIVRVVRFRRFPNSLLVYFWVSVTRVVLHGGVVYFTLCYCESWNYTLLIFARNLIVPVTLLLTAYPCGDNYLLCISFISSAAAGLFFYLAMRMPEDLRVTEALLSLAFAFFLYFHQVLVCGGVFLVVYFLDLYFLRKASTQLVYVQKTPLLLYHVSHDRGGVYTDKVSRGRVVVLEIPNYDILLEVREGRGKLYLRTCGAVFFLNNKLLSLVRIIILWIVEQSLADSFRVTAVHVHDFDFASQDLVLIIQDYLGVLYLASSVKLSIEGFNLLSLMHFMISLCTSQSLPLLPSTIVTLRDLLTSLGVEALRLRDSSFVLPLTDLMKNMLCLVDNPVQFHQRAPQFHMELEGNNLWTFHEEQAIEGGVDHEDQDASSFDGGAEHEEREGSSTPGSVDRHDHEEQDGSVGDIVIHLVTPVMLLVFLIHEILS